MDLSRNLDFGEPGLQGLLQKRRLCDSGFPQHPDARLVLPPSFAAAACRQKESHQRRMGMLAERINMNQCSSVRQGSSGVVLQGIDQQREHARAEKAALLAFGHTPRLKFVKVGKLETLEKITAKQTQSRFQHRYWSLCTEGCCLLPQFMKIDPHACRIERHMFPIGD